MPLWFTLLLTLLGWLIQWLLSDVKPLDAKQRKRMNGFIHKCRRVESIAVIRGCKSGGEPEE